MDLNRGWPVLQHSGPLLPLEQYRGKTSDILTLELDTGSAAKPAITVEPGRQWAVDYAKPAGSLRLWVSRCTPAVLVESTRKRIAFGGPVPLSHLAYATAKDGAVRVAPTDKLGKVDPAEPWLLVWFAPGAPQGGHLTPFDTETERGVNKERLRTPPAKLDLPLLIRLEHKPTAVRLEHGKLVLEFAKQVGKLAVMPLFGGRLITPDETARWSRDPLPKDVPQACRQWTKLLRDYPLAGDNWVWQRPISVVSYSMGYRFRWLSFEDDWGSAPIKAAPVPPMLALAMQDRLPGVRVIECNGGGDGKSARPAMMDAPGPAAYVTGAYECLVYPWVFARPKMGGLFGGRDWMRTVTADALLAGRARVLRVNLNRHVRQMLKAGRLRPLFYVYGGIGGTWFSHFYFATTAELAVALREAWPFLDADVRRDALAYLRAEWKAYPPFTFNRKRYTTGTLRTPYDYPWQEVRQFQYALQREQRYRQADHLYELYGVEAYLDLTGEKPSAELHKRIKTLVRDMLTKCDWALLGPTRLREVRDRHALFYYNLQGAATYNRWLAGSIAAVRLTERLGGRLGLGTWTWTIPAGSQTLPTTWPADPLRDVILTPPTQEKLSEEDVLLGNALKLALRLALARLGQARYIEAMYTHGLVRGKLADDNRTVLHMDPSGVVIGRGPLEMGVHSNQELPPFYDLTPEVGQWLGTHAAKECGRYLRHLDRSVPLWYLSEAPKQTATEQRTCPLQYLSGNVLAQYWVLGKTGDAMARYVDTTRFVGDFYYIRNLAAALESYLPKEE